MFSKFYHMLGFKIRCDFGHDHGILEQAPDDESAPAPIAEVRHGRSSASKGQGKCGIAVTARALNAGDRPKMLRLGEREILLGYMKNTQASDPKEIVF